MISIPHHITARYNQTRSSEVANKLCHAPSASLNFDQFGNATVCCYNRQQLLGKFPEQSISSIWFGKKAKAFRNKFSSNTLADGCYLCAIQLKSENFHGAKSKGYDMYQGSNSASNRKNLITKLTGKVDWPKVIELEIDNTCNLECTMCNGYYSSSIRKNRENLPPIINVYDDSFLAQLEPFLQHAQEVKFLGGEPFLSPLYYKIWEMILRVNPKLHCVITTNATIITNKVQQLIANLNCSLVVSIDSFREDTYNSIRINANFSKVRENISLLNNIIGLKGNRLSFSTCPMVANIEEIPEMVANCNQNNQQIFFNTVLEPYHLSLRSMEIDELESVCKIYREADLQILDEVEKFNHGSFHGLLNQIEGLLAEKKYHIKFLEELQQLPVKSSFFNFYTEAQKQTSVGFGLGFIENWEGLNLNHRSDSMITIEELKDFADCLKAYASHSGMEITPRLAENLAWLEVNSNKLPNQAKLVQDLFATPLYVSLQALNTMETAEYSNALMQSFNSLN